MVAHGLSFHCSHAAFLRFLHGPLLPFTLLQGIGRVLIPKQELEAQQLNIDVILLMIVAHARGAVHLIDLFNVFYVVEYVLYTRVTL